MDIHGDEMGQWFSKRNPQQEEDVINDVSWFEFEVDPPEPKKSFVKRLFPFRRRGSKYRQPAEYQFSEPIVLERLSDDYDRFVAPPPARFPTDEFTFRTHDNKRHSFVFNMLFGV